MLYVQSQVWPVAQKGMKTSLLWLVSLKLIYPGLATTLGLFCDFQQQKDNACLDFIKIITFLARKHYCENIIVFMIFYQRAFLQNNLEHEHSLLIKRS